MTTITIDRELLEQALAALETMTDEYDDSAVGLEIEAIHALRAALEAPATAPEKTVKEIMEFARHYAANTFSSATLEDKIRRSLAAPATAPDLSDAYAGAREDLKIWKKRALEAEETVRQLNRALAEEVDGPTFMGEPVLPATAPDSQEVKQIAEALRRIGMTLVHTGTGFMVLPLGTITAQEDRQ